MEILIVVGNQEVKVLEIGKFVLGYQKGKGVANSHANQPISSYALKILPSSCALK
jgi:hypothetical protein